MIDVHATEEYTWSNPRFEWDMIHVLLSTLDALSSVNVDGPETIRKHMIKLGKVHKVAVVGWA